MISANVCGHNANAQLWYGNREIRCTGGKPIRESTPGAFYCIIISSRMPAARFSGFYGEIFADAWQPSKVTISMAALLTMFF
jgi:hypothetical protein